jgi:hypothetical protein
MNQSYEFSLWLRVLDPEKLLAAALAHPDAAGDTRDDYLDEGGEIDTNACLVMLLDPGTLPGCEILDSGAHFGGEA